MNRLRCVILSLLLLVSYMYSVAQSLCATGAYIDAASPLDFVMGESVTEYTTPAAIGFLPAMYYSAYSSEKQLTDSASIQVHFDNELQQATIFMAQEMTSHNPRYVVCGMDGIVHLQGIVNRIPYFIHYAQLPAGVYILRVEDIPNRIPYTTRWLKK